MINKVMSSHLIPKAVKAASASGSGNRMQKFMRSEALGKVLDVAADNQTLCQSLFALAICVGPRPATNFLITEDKQDATYASCHSISSGVVGFVWPLVFATPIAVGVKRIAKNPHKYLNPKIVKQFYEDVATKTETVNGKKIEKILTNAEGKMLRKDGSILCQSHEPLMIYGEESQKAFEEAYPRFYVERGTNVARIKPVQRADGGWDHVKTDNGVGKFKIEGDKAVPVGEAVQAKDFTVDKNGVLRSTERFEMENGVEKLDADGEKIGVRITQEELTPITESMEIGAKKEENVKKFINMVPDILLAPLRASLTIALIPPLLNTFGIRKSSANKPQDKSLNVVSYSNNTNSSTQTAGTASAFSAFKKGGV